MKCEHELIDSDLIWNDTKWPVKKCKYCGKYGDVSRGFGRGGGHKIIIFRGISEEIEAGRIVKTENAAN